MHAEEAALEKLESRVRAGRISRSQLRAGVDVLSLRLDNDGALRCAMPCARCSAKLRKAALVMRVQWSEDDGRLSNPVPPEDLDPVGRSSGDPKIWAPVKPP